MNKYLEIGDRLRGKPKYVSCLGDVSPWDSRTASNPPCLQILFSWLSVCEGHNIQYDALLIFILIKLFIEALCHAWKHLHLFLFLHPFTQHFSLICHLYVFTIAAKQLMLQQKVVDGESGKSVASYIVMLKIKIKTDILNHSSGLHS